MSLEEARSEFQTKCRDVRSSTVLFEMLGLRFLKLAKEAREAGHSLSADVMELEKWIDETPRMKWIRKVNASSARWLGL